MQSWNLHLEIVLRGLKIPRLHANLGNVENAYLIAQSRDRVEYVGILELESVCVRNLESTRDNTVAGIAVVSRAIPPSISRELPCAACL